MLYDFQKQHYYGLKKRCLKQYSIHGLYFVNRFSQSHSRFAHVSQFENIMCTLGESAEQHLSKLAQIIDYGGDQVRDKSLSTLPSKCRTTVPTHVNTWQ